MLDEVVSEMKANKAATLQRPGPLPVLQRSRREDHGARSHPRAPRSRPSHPQGLAGKPFGAEIRKVAKPGKVAEVSYMYKRPGSAEQEPKVSLVTKVGDQVCAVGYYKK